MTKEEKFKREIEKISRRIDERVELLERYSLEYKEECKIELHNDCVIKYRLLEMVSKDLYNALALIA